MGKVVKRAALAIILLTAMGLTTGCDSSSTDDILGTTFSLEGSWLITTDVGKDYVGMQINSSGDMIDLMGFFGINHPTTGTSSITELGAFNVNSFDLGGFVYA